MNLYHWMPYVNQLDEFIRHIAEARLTDEPIDRLLPAHTNWQATYQSMVEAKPDDTDFAVIEIYIPDIHIKNADVVDQTTEYMIPMHLLAHYFYGYYAVHFDGAHYHHREYVPAVQALDNIKKEGG